MSTETKTYETHQKTNRGDVVVTGTEEARVVIGSALARALAKAQAVMEGASKDKTNPAFKSRYADLASVWDACREPLTSNGLAVVQLVTSADKTSVTVETRLLHEGGESLSSTLTLPVEKATAQGVGSAITYARRYGLSAMVGVAPDDDDDGHEASKPARPYTPPTVQAPPSRPPTAEDISDAKEIMRKANGSSRGFMAPETIAGAEAVLRAAPPMPPSNVTPMGATLEVQIQEWAQKFTSCATLDALDAAGRELAQSRNTQLKAACRGAYDMRREVLKKASAS